MSGGDDTAQSATLVLFSLDGQRFALPYAQVERVVRAVEITQLPNAPSVTAGVVNVAGTLVCVLDLRQRFGMPGRALRWSDQFIIARTPARVVGLWVDTADIIVELPAERLLPREEVPAESEHIQGVVKLEDGLVLIHDLERCLSAGEEQALAQALEDYSP